MIDLFAANNLSKATASYNVAINYRCQSGAQQQQQPTECDGMRTGNLLIGRESQVYASSTCGLNKPQTFCNKDRRCYLCDSRKSNLTGKPIYPLKDHSIGQVIKRHRYDRQQHNVTYARELFNELVANNSSITPMEQQQTANNYSQQQQSQQQQHSWWQAENGAENVTIQLDLENEFLFTHLIMHFNSFYPAQASVERSFDFGHTWHVYQYYATSCQTTYPNVNKGPKRRVNETVCEDLPSLDPSDDGELVMKVLAPTPAYVANRERTLVDTLDNISMYSEELMQEYHELKRIMRMTNLRINLIKLQTLGDELHHTSSSTGGGGGNKQRQQHYDEQTTSVLDNTDDDDNMNDIHLYRYHDRMKDERSKAIYHFGLYDLFVYGSCSCNGHSNRCVKQPIVASASTQHKQQQQQLAIIDNELSSSDTQHTEPVEQEQQQQQQYIEDMVYGHCDCENNTQGANCNECQEFYNDWPWRPHSECKQCQCNNHAQKCKFSWKLFEQSNRTSGGVCEECLHNTRGAKCHLCQMGFVKQSDKKMDDLEACQLCRCNTEQGTQDKCKLCYQGDQHYEDKDENGVLNKTEMRAFFTRIKQSFHGRSLQAGQCLCKANVGGLSCDQCLPGHFNYGGDVLNGCQRCSCHANGTQLAETEVKPVTLCDPVDGKCRCKDNVTGQNCDTCQEGFYGLEQFGECRACECDLNLANTTDTSCHPVTGQCKCKANTFGRRCDQCQDGYWSYPECKLCTCNGHASSCDQSTGECRDCGNYTTGPYCDECLPGYYGQPIMPLQMSAQSSVGKSMISDDINELVFVPCSPCSCPGYGPQSTEYHASECRSVKQKFQQQPIMKSSSSAASSSASSSSLDSQVDSSLQQQLQHFVQLPTTHNNNSSNSVAAFNRASSSDQQTTATNINQGQADNQLAIRLTTTKYKQAFECVCKPGFIGAMCELCAPNYWGPSKHLGKDCRLCDCNNNWNISAHDNCDKNTGKCLKCTNNSEGDHCQLCRLGYHGDATQQSCQLCQCHSIGTRYELTTGDKYYLPCDRHTGQCQCADHVRGDHCDQCQVNYWNMTVGVGCERCNCDPDGTLAVTTNDDVNGTTTTTTNIHRSTTASSGTRPCHPETGQCECKSGYGGRKCNQCATGFWGNPNSERKCKTCNCNKFGSRSNDCDKSTGQCDCLIEMTGKECEKCATGYYFNRTTTTIQDASKIHTNNNNINNTSDYRQLDSYNLDILNDIPSAKNCLRCGECYDQWLTKLTSLRQDTEGLSLSYRRSASFKAMNLNFGHISLNRDKRVATLSDFSVRYRRPLASDQAPLDPQIHLTLTTNEEQYIEAKLHSIVKTMNQEKMATDKFIWETRNYNETMLNLLSDVHSFLYPFFAMSQYDASMNQSHDQRQLELEASELMEQMDYVELLKQQLDGALQQLDMDRISMETTLLRQSGRHFNNDWKLNFLRAQQLFNSTTTLDDDINNAYEMQNKLLLDIRHIYQHAIHHYANSNTGNGNTTTTTEWNQDQRVYLLQRLASFSIERPTALLDRNVHHDDNHDNNMTKDNCTVTKWRHCSTDLRSFQQQQLPDLVQTSIELIQQHNATISQATNTLESEYLMELEKVIESFMNNLRPRLKQKLEPWLDRFIGKDMAELSVVELTGRLNYTDRLIGALQNSSLTVDRQSSQMENMVKSIKNLTHSYEILLKSQRESDLETMLANDIAKEALQPDRVNHLQPLVLIWHEIELELRKELWPKFEYINQTGTRYQKASKSIELLLASADNLNLVQNDEKHMMYLYEANKMILEDIDKDNDVSLKNFDFIESVLLNLTQMLNNNNNNVDRLSTTHSVSRWRTEHNYNLIEQVIHNTNRTLDRLNEIMSFSSNNDIVESPTKELMLSQYLVQSVLEKWNTTTSGRVSSNLEQLLRALGDKIESDTDKWWRLRHNASQFQLELEFDQRLLGHYGQIESELVSAGNKLEDNLRSLRAEHNELSEDIKAKWLYYEKCQG